MFCPRTDRSLALAAALALAACAAPVETTLLDASGEFDTVERKQKPPPPPPPDAKPKPADACPAPDPGVPGVVSCYAGYDPGGACALPTHCCFGNYSAQHDGECSASQCVWGTISCDGPEDCPSGQRCCAHALVDPEWGITGYKLACQASACGLTPANEELCHTTSSPAGTCASGTACVAASGVDWDLPPTLHVCR
jgi:hypothetical protein